MAENLKLKNTVQVDGTEYDINAVYSDEAKKVTNPLIVKESGTRAFDFDGSEKNQTIDYVPTTGGIYSGIVHITKTAADTITNDPIYNSAVLTSEQVTNRVTNLNGAPLCIWNADGNYQMHTLKKENDQLYKLTTVVGTTESFESFKNYMTTLSRGLKFTLATDHKTCWVSGIGDCTDTVIHIPEYNDDGIPVTHIGAGAFRNNTQITEVVIPWGITSIDTSAFYGCTSLQKIIMSDSVTSIGENAFYGCSNLSDILLGAGVKEIGEHVFHSCVMLEGIILPEGLTKIARGLFYGCEKLSSIILPQGITHIGSAAFYECKALTTIVIPKTVISIDYSAFGECISLNSPVDPEVNPDLESGVYYEGTQAEWDAFINGGWDDTNDIGLHSQQNSWLKTAKLVEQNFEYAHNVATGGTINASDVANGPFIYICRDTDEEFNSANRMYIKLPGDDQIVEVSRGATVLSSNYTNDGYTYEGIAEVLARINKRLEAIGGEELKINNAQTTLINVPTIKDVNNLVPDKEVVEYLDPNSIPTVQELKQLITELRADLNELEDAVEWELTTNPTNPVFAAESRIDKLETWQKNFRANEIDYYDTIEWTD
jgi:hypothetical protein